MSEMLRKLCPGPVIPAARTSADLAAALAGAAPAVILLFGDINTLPGLLADAARHGKKLIIHLDLLDGVGKDKAGVRHLARLGVTALITTKSQLVRAARDEGMLVIQRIFLMDSEALRTAGKMLKQLKPDAVEVLPASVPAWVFRDLAAETGLPVFAGGLVASRPDIDAALVNGAAAVSTSHPELW